MHKIPKFFIDGKRKFSIIHARLRNFCSNLNQDLFDNHSKNWPYLQLPKRCTETAEHYFFKCENFIQIKEYAFSETPESFIYLNVNTLLQGKGNIVR